MYEQANRNLNTLLGIKKPTKKNTFKTTDMEVNLSVNAQTFLNNFKERIKNTNCNEGVILTTVNNDSYKAYLELIQFNYLEEIKYERGFSTFILK